MTVKNIIFDMGGVILNLDFSLTSKAFRRLGAFHLDAVFTRNRQDHLFDLYETGKISCEAFRAGLCERLGIRATDEVFDAAWNAMLLDIPKNRLEFIKTLRKDFRVFLFSNTNAIHMREVFNFCRNHLGIDGFSEYFDREYYSFVLGQRKPDPASFVRIVSDNHFKAHETLFVDDSLQNVLGAREAGLHALHLTAEKSVFDTLRWLERHDAVFGAN